MGMAVAMSMEMEMEMKMKIAVAMEMENCNYIFSTLQIAVFYKLNFISRLLYYSTIIVVR